jgi:hypothetical protein
MIAAEALSSTNPFPLDPSGFSRESRDFKALQEAIQAGNLPNARGAFSTFQQDLQRASFTAGGSNPFSPSGPLGHDLQLVGNALEAGNPVNAQKAFTTLRQDMKGVFQPAGNQAAGPDHSRHRKNAAEQNAGRTSVFTSFSNTAGRPAGILLDLRG